MTLKNVLSFIRMNLGTVSKFAVIVFEFILFITLMIVAMTGGVTEKLWMVLAVVLCFAIWVLYLLFQREKEREAHKETSTALRATTSAFVGACKELENYRKLQVPRLSLISRQRR